MAVVDTRSAKPAPKEADAELLTAEHRAWRDEGMRLCGGYCQDPECKTPNRKPSRLFADHIKERQDGGAPLDPNNRMMRCGSCHTKKTVVVRADRMRS